MLVRVLDYSSGRRQVMGHLRQQGQSVVFDGEFPPVVKTSLSNMLIEAGSAERFLRILPELLTGSRLRAEHVNEQ